jgi:hypothetical protein
MTEATAYAPGKSEWRLAHVLDRYSIEFGDPKLTIA